jgi:transposase
VRRRRQREADPERRAELFRCRWLLLKGAERLTPEEQPQLARALADEELRSGWALKEELRMWYQSATPADAEERLSTWEETVRRQGPAEFRTLLSFCRTWRQEILNYFTWPYTNGFVEGKNNRIKAIKRRGYGYRNRDNLRQQVFLSNRVLVASAA